MQIKEYYFVSTLLWRAVWIFSSVLRRYQI